MNRSESAKRQIYYFSAVMLTAGSTFFANYLFSQWLNIEDYGRFGLYLATLGVCISFVMLGQATAFTTVYFSDEKRGGLSVYPEFFKSIYLITISSLAFLIAGFSIWIIFFSERIDLTLLVPLSIAIVFIAFRDFFINVLVCTDSYRFYLFAIIIFSLCLLSTVHFGRTIESYFYGLAIGGGTLSLIVFVFQRSLLKSMSIDSQVTFTSKNLLLFGWAAIPGMLISSLNSYVDRYMIYGMLSLKEVGLYTLAATVSIGVGGILTSSLMRANVVTLLRILQQRDEKSYHIFAGRVYFGLGLFALFAVFCYYFFGRVLIVFVFGDKYAEASSYMLPLFLCVLLISAGQFSGQTLIQSKKLPLLVSISILTLAANAIFNYLFIPIFGIAGAILAFALSALISLQVVCYNAKRIHRFVEYPIKFSVFVLGLIVITLWVGI